MKYRRWVALALVCVGLTYAAAAFATQTVSLEEIGLRYLPTDGEICVTRNEADPRALSAFGTDADTLRGAMVRDGLYLMTLLPDGRQISLGVSAKPDALTATDAFQLSSGDKDAFLALLARRGGYGNATWAADGYALFSSTAQNPGESGLSYTDLSLSTLYLNQIYTFRMDLIGREAVQDDADQLIACAARTLRLGAAAQTETAQTADAAPTETLSLPESVVTGDPVPFTYLSQTCDLTLDPIASPIGLTTLTVTGKTVPDGYLRYSVNGTTSSRVKADADGAFRLTMPTLTGNAENSIEIIAFKGDLKTVVDFTVTVDWLTSPVALQSAGEVEAEEVTLSGVVLPGSSVTLTKGKGAGRVAVAKDGTFRLRVLLPRVGQNDFILQSQTPGYRRNDYAFSITRKQAEADVVASLQKKVRTVGYSRLLAKPSAYADRVIAVSGVATALSYASGAPRFVLTTDAGECYTVLCDQLLRVTDSAAVALLGTLTGQTDDAGYPTLTLEAFVS